MWELRLIWVSEKPGWWDTTWKTGIESLARQQRTPESRPDVYLVLPDRVDVGLKLRGGAEGDFDAKALHCRSAGWELGEKIAFFRWDTLEAVRFAAMIRVAASFTGVASDVTPTVGAKRVLETASLKAVEVKVEKKRIQGNAGTLLAPVSGHSAHPGCLAELVQIELSERTNPLFSVCLETMDPLQSGIDTLPRGGALHCGYPELLVKHVRGAL
jgi:hypothetical protein